MTHLSAADFIRVEALFAEAASLDQDGRVRLLDASCADRPDLRAEAASLLAAHDRMASSPAPETGDAFTAGTRLGAYRLAEKIGEGGMGEVYRAERDDGAFVQQVAVKITRTAIGQGDVLRRFRIERQILASLHHANIVTLLDGGATNEGQAYLVMEYVAGDSITHYCRAHALSIEERLGLFATVCAAVQYAHQHGVVHRDLKPANIVITNDGVPKVLDFGVAKLLAAHEQDHSATVGVMPAPMTPNYASPEQLRGLPVTTASDVYALGVLLFELTTGQRPYETQGMPFDEVLETVAHATAPRPSTVNKRLRGDVDAIVTKAMSKEPADRYASAGELASDIQRFLNGDQVVARQPSIPYVLKRLAARNRAVVTIGALALLAIIIAGGAALWQREIARRAQERAERRFADVRQLANALVFKIHDAIIPLAGSTSVRRVIVDEALVYLQRLEAESPLDAALRLELASVYGRLGNILGHPQSANLGDRDGAVQQLEHARELVLPLATDRPGYDVVRSLVFIDRQLTAVYGARGDRARGLERAQEAVAHAERFWQLDPANANARSMLAEATFELAWASPPPAARPIWHKVLALFEQARAEMPDDAHSLRNVALVHKYLGANLESSNELAEARRHYERALAIDRERLGRAPTDRVVQFDTSISYANAATAAESSGDIDAAARLYGSSLELRRQLADSDPKDQFARARLGYLLIRVAAVHRKRNEIEPAVRVSREAVSILDGVLRTTNDRAAKLSLAEAWNEAGNAESMRARPDAACAAYRRARELFGVVSADEVRARPISDRLDQALAACGAPQS